MLYEFRNSTDISEDLYLYGDIVSENAPDWDGYISETAVDLKLFKEKMDKLGPGKTLNIFINSGGGDIFAASAMISMIKRAKANSVKVIAYIDAVAASAASLFPFVADEAHIYINSILMIHKPSAGLRGYYSANELRKFVDALDVIESGTMMPLYNAKSKLTEQRTKNLVAAETWMNADQIMETFDGFILHDEAKKAVACASEYFGQYINTPQGFIQKSTAKSTKPDLSAFENRLNSLKRKEI